MRVSKVELVEVSDIGDHKENQPQTFFSLSSPEKSKYNAYRVKRDSLEGILRNLKNEERAQRESELREMFTDLVTPYFQNCELEVEGCSSCYGEDKKTLMETPRYTLFKDNRPFDIALKVIYWFSTKDENLSCSTHFDLRSVDWSTAPERQVVYDLVNKAMSEKVQDGINFPFIRASGSFLYFASTEFAMPIIRLIKGTLEKIGPEAVEEMNVLYREYMDQKSRPYQDSRIKERVFRRAYEEIMQTELIKAGISERKLVIVR